MLRGWFGLRRKALHPATACVGGWNQYHSFSRLVGHMLHVREALAGRPSKLQEEERLDKAEQPQRSKVEPDSEPGRHWPLGRAVPARQLLTASL